MNLSHSGSQYQRYWIMTMMTACLSGAPAFAYELVPHQVTYQLKLKQASQESQISEIKGRTQFSMIKECDGWKSAEDYLMQMVFEDGNEIYLASLFDSFENDAGSLFSFTIDERTSYDKPLTFDGFAELSSGATASQDSASGSAFFSIEPDTAVTLPEDTVFPIANTLEILARAEAGDSFYTSHIFFGAKPDDALKKISVVIGKEQTADNNDTQSDLLMAYYYPVNIAYFDPKSTDGVPSYEISFQMQKNGVVPYYTVDYGDFILQADLDDIKAEALPSC